MENSLHSVYDYQIIFGLIPYQTIITTSFASDDGMRVDELYTNPDIKLKFSEKYHFFPFSSNEAENSSETML